VSGDWLHSARPPEGGWGSQFADGLAPIWTRHEREVMAEYRARIASGAIDNADPVAKARAVEEASHEIVTRVARDTGFRYERTKLE